MEERRHGGNWAENGGDSRAVLDFSANVSPLGVPPRVRQAIRRAAGRADAYPDPECRRLREELSRAENVPADWILCGNGAADLIHRAVRAVGPVRAAVPAPTFSEYEYALRLSGCGDIVRVSLGAEDGFQPEFAFFRRFMQALGGTAAGDGPAGVAVGTVPYMAGGAAETVPDTPVPTVEPDSAPGPAMAFLCQPNNPTGVPTPRPVLDQILERCREKGVLLVMDECFLPFLDRPEEFSLSGSLADYDNLLILRAFTKSHGMAGVRLGYALSSNRALLDRMDWCAPPWSVSALAQEAGIAALQSGDYLRRVRQMTARERPRLRAGLDALGLRTIPGEANFLLFRSPVPLDAPLLERGIVLRNCGNFHGLDESWYRTAVRTARENRRLLDALGEILRRAR